MSHEIEFIEGRAQMAYAGKEKPWHGLGVSVEEDITPMEMMKVAGLDWDVIKRPMYFRRGEKNVKTDRLALIRDRDNRLLDVVSDSWMPCQNREAFEFFNEWCEAGDMHMNTAGSLRDGKMVWALAKINGNSFEACRGDKVDGYLLFSNPHTYGKTIEVRMTNIRVVCNNTLTMALSGKVNNMIKINHAKAFDAGMVKAALDFTKKQTEKYAEASKFLATKKCTPEQIHEYINRLFPIGENAARPDRAFSKPGQKIFDVIETQPGADLAPGTFWNLFNATTFFADHLQGTSVDTRLSSSWFGRGQSKKVEALNLALEMAA